MSNTIATAPLVSTQRGSTSTGEAYSGSDYYVKFILQEPSGVNVSLTGLGILGGADIKLVKVDGTDVGSGAFKSQNAGIHDEFINTAAIDSTNGILKPGTYYVKVSYTPSGYTLDSQNIATATFNLKVKSQSATKYRAYMVNRGSGSASGSVYAWDFTKAPYENPTHVESFLYGLTNNSYFNYSPAVGDFNQDGNPDLVFRSLTTGDNYVNYAGGASNLISNFSGSNTYPAGTGDFNGDGYVDIVWRDVTNGLQTVTFMGGTGGIVPQSTASIGTYVSADHYLAIGDVDGNGTSDLIWTHSDGTVYVWYMDGTTITSKQVVNFPKNFGAGNYVTGVADVDSDSNQDFLYTNFAGSYFWGFGGRDAMSTSKPNPVYLTSAPDYQIVFPGFVQDTSLINQANPADVSQPSNKTLRLEYGLPNAYSNTSFVQYDADPSKADVDSYRVQLQPGGTLSITSSNSTLWTLKLGSTTVATGGTTVTTGSLSSLAAGTYNITVSDPSTTTTPKAYTLNVSRSTTVTPTVTPVKSIFTGNAGSNVSKFVKLPNGNVIFAADSTDTGRELYVTDGTTGGTTLLKDINSGVGSSNPSDFVSFGGTSPLYIPTHVYFIADDGVDGRELWKTDGTANGTVLVKNINTVAIPDTTPALNEGSDASDLKVIDNVIYFSAADGTNGQEPWKSDGTANGTVMIKDLEPGAEGSYPYEFTRLNGTTTVFGATTTTNGNEIYKTDGSSSGTSVAFNVQSGAGNADVQNLVAYDGKVFASAKTPSNGVEVIQTDGSTYTVLDINSGTSDSNPSLTYAPTVPGGPPGTLFVSATGSSGRELYKIVSATGSPTLVKDINTSGDSNPVEITTIDSLVYFSADDGVNGRELWKSDGTSSGTVRLSNINPTGSSDPFGFTKVGSDEIYFTASNKANLQNAELWKYTISTGVVSLAKEIVTGDQGGLPTNLIPIGSDLLIVANDGSVGSEPTKFTVSSSALTNLKDISSAPSSAGPRDYFTLGTQTYFTVTDTLGQTKTFKTDGTDAGTEEVSTTGSVYDPGQIVESGGTGYGVGYFEDYGYELFKFNGTAFTRLSDIVSGNDSSPISNLESHNDGYLYFTSYDATNGEALWRTNGSAPTKVQTFTMSSDFPSRQVMSYPERNALYVIAYSDVTGDYEVWEYSNATRFTSNIRYEYLEAQPDKALSFDFTDATLNRLGKGTTWDKDYNTTLYPGGQGNGTPLTLGKGKLDHLPNVSFEYKGFLEDLLFINGIPFHYTDGKPNEQPAPAEGSTSVSVWSPFKYWSDYSAKVDCDRQYNNTKDESNRIPFLNDYAIYKNAIYFGSGDAAVDYEGGKIAPMSKVLTGYEPVGKHYSTIFYQKNSYLNPTNPALKAFNGIELARLFPGDCEGCPEPEKPTDKDIPLATSRHSSDVNRQFEEDSPENNASKTYRLNSGSGAFNFTSLNNGYILFIADDGLKGEELWAIVDKQSDSAFETDFDVQLISDIEPGAGSSNISNMVVLGNQAYFTACTTATGCEVYTSGGASAVKLTNLPDDVAPENLQVTNGTVYFSYWDAATKSMKLTKAS